jgi:putative pyoverdin transport system ATP-binding/permease protein
MSSLRLFAFLLRNSRGTVILMTLAGALSGMFSAGVIALIARVVARPHDTPTLLAIGFIALAAAKIVSTLISQLLLVRFSQGAILGLSVDLCEKVVLAPLRKLEQRGVARILATLTDDVSAVTWAIQCIPQLAMNLAVLVGCAGYLLWLSWKMFVCTIIAVAVGALVYQFLHNNAFEKIRAAREARSQLFGHFRNLTAGLKELMMHRQRREEFVRSEVRAAAEASRVSNLQATTHYAIAEGWIQAVFYGLIGILLFAPGLIGHPATAAVTGYAFAMLYATSPLWAVIGALPAVARGQVALEQIRELGVFIASESTPEKPRNSADVVRESAEPLVEMRGVEFHYESTGSGEKQFTLGPIDFQLRCGELVFVVGGNGSGKSTFVKVLCGLYAPQQGEMLSQGVRVDAGNRADYREGFSVVFSDCFLFEKLLGLNSPDVESAARQYLKLLQMDRKVDIADRRYSTTDLSTGQRKRLALITAYLEDRPVYVFDEWAADQDPEYKDVFYRKLLPDLRHRGKAVVVITHDDRYFHLGSRVIRLEDGRIAPDSSAGRPSRVARGEA